MSFAAPVQHSGSAKRSAKNPEFCLQIAKNMILASEYYRPESGSWQGPQQRSSLH
jgi:hypothetical protein